MEFVQFHPTALSVAGPGSGFLISEAVRGEGAHLLNRRGERFMVDQHEAGELAPRDELTRAIVAEMERTGDSSVYLSLAHLDRELVERRFSSIADRLHGLGLDLASEPIPVSPAAHYMMGGIETDLHGRSSLPGLLACGEVACTGVHGANRLASNSLLECLVFADRAGRVDAAGDSVSTPDDGVSIPANPLTAANPAVLEIMWNNVGVRRTAEGLSAACNQLVELERGADGVTGRSDALVGRLVASAALAREESRGSHFREDFPTEREPWRLRTRVTRVDGDIVVTPRTQTAPAR
jgi:L-aspartate oxidase